MILNYKQDVDKAVIVLGSGGHAKVVIDTLLHSGINIEGIISPDIKMRSHCSGIKIIGDDDIISNYKQDEILLANGVGSLPHQEIRWGLARKYREMGYEFIQVIHPSAQISDSVNIKDGVQIMAGAVVQPDSLIGQDSIINSGVCIDHDCIVGKNCHLAPRVTLSGGVNIGDGTHLGTGSIVIQNISIGRKSIIAAGSVVYRNIPDNVTFLQSKNDVIK